MCKMNKNFLKIFVVLFIVSLAFFYTYKRDKKQNVLLIVVDTLSAKHIPIYNKDVSIETNFINNLAQNGMIFKKVFTTSSWTKPTISSIISGYYPSEHGVGSLTGVMPNEIKTLPNYLKDYQPLAVISHTILDEKSNILKNFESVKNVNMRNPHANIVANTVTDEVIKKLGSRNKEKPFLMFAHYFDPHYNYQDHKSIEYTDKNYKGKISSGLDIKKLRTLPLNDNDKKHLRNLYHEEITYTDRALMRLYNYLKEKNILDDTLIIFVADHGEELAERGWIGHTKTLYNELINVPLIISGKNIKPRQVSTNISQIDILPTILDFLKIENTNLQGVSLLREEIPTRNLFSEVTFSSSKHIKDANKVSVVNKNNKLIFDRDKKTYEFYDLDTDKDELNNLINDESKQTIISKLKIAIDNFDKKESNLKNSESKIKFNEKEVKQLESLGYM